MEKQVLVIQYVGNMPTQPQVEYAVEALQRAGCHIDATVQPTVISLNEKEQAQAMAMHAIRKERRGEGITITVKNQEPIITEEKAKKLATALRQILADE